MKITDANIELYESDVVIPRDRLQYIVSPYNSKKEWIQVNGDNQLVTLGQQEILFNKWLSKELIRGHLEEQFNLGQKIRTYNKNTSNEYSATTNLEFDIDRKVGFPIVEKLMYEILHKTGPDISASSYTPGHERYLYLFDNHFSDYYLDLFKKHYEPYLNSYGVETFPGDNGSRNLFGVNSHLLNQDHTPILINDKNATIKELHNLLHYKTELSSTAEFKAYLRHLDQQYNILHPAQRKQRRQSNGKWWEYIKRLETVGLEAPSTRYDATREMVRACVYRGMGQDETAIYVLNWTIEKSNGYSSEVKAENHRRIIQDIDGWYRGIYKTYDPTIAELRRVTVNGIERKYINTLVVKKLGLVGDARGRKQKAIKVLTNIYQHCKSNNSNIVPISKNLWVTFGDAKNYKLGFRKLLIDKGMIKVHRKKYFSIDGSGEATQYKIEFYTPK